MDSLNELEIQNIRHLVGAASNFCAKCTYYKSLTNDTEIKNIYDNICTQCDNLKQNLSNIL